MIKMGHAVGKRVRYEPLVHVTIEKNDLDRLGQGSEVKLGTLYIMTVLRWGVSRVSLWTWTFLVTLATAAVGLSLFAGFTFQVKPRYPFLLVTCHVIGAFATVTLYCILFVRWMGNHNTATHLYAAVVLWVSLVVILSTFISGIYFYFRYNARRRGLGYRLLITHLVMAALSFVCVIASVSELSGTGISAKSLFPPSSYNFYKHHHQRAQVSDINSP